MMPVSTPPYRSAWRMTGQSAAASIERTSQPNSGPNRPAAPTVRDCSSFPRATDQRGFRAEARSSS
jgi:hypothetical protein